MKFLLDFSGINNWWWSLLRGKFFLVVEEGISKFLPSAGLLLIPWVGRENVAIWFKFGPK